MCMKGLGRTLFERLQSKFKEDISAMLNVQYRMHEDIMTWSSKEMYGGHLQAHESVALHRLRDIPVRHTLAPCPVINISRGCTAAQNCPGYAKLAEGDCIYDINFEVQICSVRLCCKLTHSYAVNIGPMKENDR